MIIPQCWSCVCWGPFPEVEIVVFYESHSFTLSFLCCDFVETPPFFVWECSHYAWNPNPTSVLYVYYSATSLIWDILHACIERVVQASTLSLHPYHLHCRSRVFYPWEWKNPHDICEIMLCELWFRIKVSFESYYGTLSVAPSQEDISVFKAENLLKTKSIEVVLLLRSLWILVTGDF